MAIANRAWHLRAFGSALGREVDRWLGRADLSVDVNNDAYEATASLLTACEPVPVLALVDADSLNAADRAILHYLIDTWPGTPLLLYGEERPPVPEPFVAHCRSMSRAELLAEIARTPLQFSESIRLAASGDSRASIADKTGSSARDGTELASITRLPNDSAAGLLGIAAPSLDRYDEPAFESTSAFTADDLAAILGARRRPQRHPDRRLPGEID